MVRLMSFSRRGDCKRAAWKSIKPFLIGSALEQGFKKKKKNPIPLKLSIHLVETEAHKDMQNPVLILLTKVINAGIK